METATETQCDGNGPIKAKKTAPVDNGSTTETPHRNNWRKIITSEGGISKLDIPP